MARHAQEYCSAVPFGKPQWCQEDLYLHTLTKKLSNEHFACRPVQFV